MDHTPEVPKTLKKLELEIFNLSSGKAETLLALIVAVTEALAPNAMVVGGVADDVEQPEAGDEPAQSA